MRPEKNGIDAFATRGPTRGHWHARALIHVSGQIFANSVAPPEIRGSIQALVFAATTGVGLLLGTQFAGIVMDMFAVEGKFQWRKIWLVPCLVMLAGGLAMILLFQEPPPAAG